MIRMGIEFIWMDHMCLLLHRDYIRGFIPDYEVLLFNNSTTKTIENSVIEITEDKDNS